MVTRPVITSMAETIRLHWRRVVAVIWGWRHWQSATISTIGALRCGVWVVILHNATLHDNGPPYLIFGEGIVDNAEYKDDSDSVVSWPLVDDQEVECRITRDALMSHFRADYHNLIFAFGTHLARIQQIAEKLIVRNRFEEGTKTIVIRSQDVSDFLHNQN